MARAYIVYARKDIDDNGLQILDLQPNTSQRNSIYDPPGQTGYLAFASQNDTVAHTNDAGVLKATATYYGLAAYIGARVDDITGGGHMCPVAADANAAAVAILARVRQGLALTTAGINTAIQTVVGLGTSGITGTGNSTATVTEILRIISGEAFKITATSAFSGAAGIFLGTAGEFVALTTVNGIVTYPSDWRHVRAFTETGYLHISRDAGSLSKLCASTFVWNNPAKTYGASGDALWIDDTHLTTTTGRALVVYDASGNVLTN
jgi:hypothetical protein